ncbi:hypothetical protein PC116_g34478, partial [Phytophthora cactorum]
MEVLEEYEPMRYPNATKIFLNGSWIGVHQDPKSLVRDVQQLRRANQIPSEVSLVRDIRDREFKIFSDAGRVMRPLFVVQQEDDPEAGITKGSLALTKEMIQRLEASVDLDPESEEYFGWQGLVNEGVIEYLDAEEEETAMICMTPEDLETYRMSKLGYDVSQDN